jgi:O-antigen/teichoic acid export membrane protein
MNAASGGVRRVAANMAWNWTGAVVAMACGFVVAPFLIRHLGETGYGLWIVLGSLAGYFSLLDLGIRGAVGRNIALHRSLKDDGALSETFNSALGLMVCAGAVGWGLAIGLSEFILGLLNVPPEYVASTRLALYLVNASMALNFPLQVFDGALWGHQRFDTLNWVDIPAVLIRAGLSVYFVSAGYGLVALAATTFAVGLCTGAAKAVFSFRESRAIRIDVGRMRWSVARTLFGYGRWTFLISIARLGKAQWTPLMIGTVLDVAFVTPYTIARRLQDYAYATLWTATGVLTPVATDLHARDDRSRQQQFFIEGGAWCFGVGLYFLTLFVFLGKPLIVLWVGEPFAYVWTFLVILSAGETIPMSQTVTGYLLLGMAKHRPLAILVLVELVLIFGSAPILAHYFGLYGICAGFAIAQSLCGGVATLIFGSRATAVPVRDYVRRASLPALARAAAPAVLLAAIVRLIPPTTWPLLLMTGAGFSVCYWSCWIGRLQQAGFALPGRTWLPSFGWPAARVRPAIGGSQE